MEVFHFLPQASGTSLSQGKTDELEGPEVQPEIALSGPVPYVKCFSTASVWDQGGINS